MNNPSSNQPHPELLKRKSSMREKPTLKINVLLSLINNITNQKEDVDSCICTYNALPNEKTNSVIFENELIPDLEFTVNEITTSIKLNDLMIKLKQLGYPLTGSMVTIFSEDVGEYINCGADPVDKNILIDKEKIISGIVKLKCTCFIEEKFLSRNFPSNTLMTAFSRNTSKVNPEKEKKRRTKERKIGYIIEKVNTWRRLYNGYYNFENEFKKRSLDDAAKDIKISKKSLDDYLLQLRLGRKFGFDFNKNKDSKVGVLRSFVKEQKKKTLGSGKLDSSDFDI